MPYGSRVIEANSGGGGTIAAGPRVYMGAYRYEDDAVSGFTLKNHNVSLALGLLERQHHVPVNGEIVLTGASAGDHIVVLLET